ncbi:phospholipase A2 inhibitor subunit gamma B-like [Podarcis lilfordi]|uniref:Phospholipase A2 inhibitor subunit gamma B-like n=1 Tax=Podarcis lilfordi TaxID=74358 RepID=A0AA35VYE6_9SAUR|nr:phospholipase A2 inhibitor subunit gamma B-like [Podarcis lilfordi]
MMKTLLISCLLLALLPPVASLICESCFDQGKDCRNATTEECDDSSDQSCLSASGVGKLSLLGPRVVLKSCIDRELCEETFASVSISSALYLQSKATCCNTDMCNSGLPEMPETETREPNGLKCPSCINIFSDECESNKTVSCRNDEDYCFYLAANMDFGESSILGAVRGCATASACNYIDGLLDTDIGSLGFDIIQAECTGAMGEDATEDTTIYDGLVVEEGEVSA